MAFPEELAANQELRHNYFGELRELRDAPPFQPTVDMDMVWAFSGHGTLETDGDLPPYTGASFDRLNIEAGIRAVYAITAERLGISPEDVTKADIEAHGPTFFYNGENEDQEGEMHYDQNGALQRAVDEDPDFPLPASKVVIHPITVGNTPGQMDSFARHMEELEADGQPHPRKVVVVSSFGHRPRVGRYLEHHKGDFPEGIEFVNGPVPNEADHDVNGIGIVRSESKRVINYRNAGHLASSSALENAA